MKYTIIIGNFDYVSANSLSECQALHNSKVDVEESKGYKGCMQSIIINHNNNEKYRVSYNGRIWDSNGGEVA